MLQMLALAAFVGQASQPEPKIIIIAPQVKPGEYQVQPAKPGEYRVKIRPQGQPSDKELTDLLQKILGKLEIDNRWAGQKDEVIKKIIRREKSGGPAQKDLEKELEAARKELEKLLMKLAEIDRKTEATRKEQAERVHAALLLQQLQEKLKKEKQLKPPVFSGTIILNQVELVPAKSPNQEVVELLKKAIRILEGKGNPKPGDPIEIELRFEKPKPQIKPGEPLRIRFEDFRFQFQPAKKTAPELEKARAEVLAAEANFHAAKARLAKLQAAPKKSDPIIIIQRKPPAPTSADLEQRINRLIQEIEELRKQIKKGGR
jgi:hypothetical protein